MTSRTQHQGQPADAAPAATTAAGGIELRLIALPPAPAKRVSPLEQRRLNAIEAEERAYRRAIEQRDHDEGTRLLAFDRAGAVLRPTAEAANYSASQPDTILRLGYQLYRWIAFGEEIPPVLSSPGEVASDVERWMQRPPGALP